MEIPVPGSRAIFVDSFRQPGGVYVCTHAHADHLCGLCVGWRHGFLHCTRATAAYLIAKTRVHERILRVHEVETEFGIEDPGGRIARAWFVDSNHCPGSVMVVFQFTGSVPASLVDLSSIHEFEDKFVVNTGDFRWHDGLRDSPALRRVASGHCQLLCLDVSFANTPFSHFPTKAESIATLLDLIDRYPSDQRFFLHSHCLGDEELLAAVALRGERLLFTDTCRFNEIKIADPHLCQASCTLLEPYVMAPDDYRFIVVASSRVRHVDQRLKHVDGIEVVCSTLWWAKRASSVHDMHQPVHDPITGIHHVLWAMHSSPEEIQLFKDFINARHVHPICQSIVGEPHVDTGRRLDVFPELVQLTGEQSPDSNQQTRADDWSWFHEPGPMANDTLAFFFEHDILPSSFAQPSSEPPAAPSASMQLMPPPAALPPARRLRREHTATTEIDRDSECSTTEAEIDDDTPVLAQPTKRQRR